MSFATQDTNLQEQHDRPAQKRKSNFDVPPPSDVNPDPVAASKIAQAKAIAALLTAYPNTNSLASVTKFLPEGQTTAGVQPYQRDEVYYNRLERAREKNIEYVKRLQQQYFLVCLLTTCYIFSSFGDRG
jgi:hypothetical protein